MSKQIREQPRKIVFPLSSRRLKLYQLQQLAQALELPTSASSDDLRVIVEEKLRAIDRNPFNTQVVMNLQEEGTENLSLQDEEGQFLHVTSPVLAPSFQFLLLENPLDTLTYGLEMPGVWVDCYYQEKEQVSARARNSGCCMGNFTFQISFVWPQSNSVH